MKKQDIDTHCEHGNSYPAINVKCYNFAHSLTAEQLNCDDDTFQQAVQFAWETAQEQFWDCAGEMVKEIFPGCECYSQGRCGGWLVVHGLSCIDSWDAIMVAKWAKLERWCKNEINNLSNAEEVENIIIGNEWHKKGSERYNFIDMDGETVCIADMKEKAISAGYGPVVRK